MPVPTAEELVAYANVHEQIATAIAGLTPEQTQALPAPGDSHPISIFLTTGSPDAPVF